MKTPIAYRFNCDRCEKDCTNSHVDVTDNSPEARFLNLFTMGQGQPERHYCSTDCLLADVAEKVEAK